VLEHRGVPENPADRPQKATDWITEWALSGSTCRQMEPKDQWRFCEVAPNTLNGLRSAEAKRCSASDASKNRHTPPATIRPEHWAELQASGIAADVAALNVASFGPDTTRHWETERAELVAHARLQIQTGSTTASGLPQAQPGHLTGRLIALDKRYRHLAAGGWRSLSAALPDLPVFDQWKPDKRRQRHDKPGKAIKYEAPPAFPDGGGLLLPQVPERIWQLICNRQGLPFPADRSGGFWPWAMGFLRYKLYDWWRLEYGRHQTSAKRHRLNNVPIDDFTRPHGRMRDGEPLTYIDTIPADVDDPEELAVGTLQAEFILKALQRRSFSDTERRVLELRSEGMTLREIGEELGFTESRACQIIARARKKLEDYTESGDEGLERAS